MQDDRRNRTPSGIPGARRAAAPKTPDPVSAPVEPEDRWTNEGGSPPVKSPSKK
jgi:hypothetical protein